MDSASKATKTITLSPSKGTAKKSRKHTNRYKNYRLGKLQRWHNSRNYEAANTDPSPTPIVVLTDSLIWMTSVVAWMAWI